MEVEKMTFSKAMLVLRKMELNYFREMREKKPPDKQDTCNVNTLPFSGKNVNTEIFGESAGDPVSRSYA